MNVLHTIKRRAREVTSEPPDTALLKSTVTYVNADQIADTAEKAILHTDSVLDIGPGLRPMSFFVPRTHIMLEGFKEYIPLLQKRFSAQPGVVFIHAKAQAALPLLADKSVDSVVMLDVIEHMTKPTARQVLAQCERVARRQIIIETPYGYVEQQYQSGEVDGWGFAHNALQDHKSGWDENDFQYGWQIFICRAFGTHQQSGTPYGLMYAIKTLEEEKARLPGKILFVSAKIPPVQDERWACLKDLFRAIAPQDAVILTDDALSAYMVGYFDVVSFAKERLAPLHLTLSGLRTIRYDDMENRLRHMALYAVDYAVIARRLHAIIEEHGISHVLFTDESQALHQHLKRFCMENRIPSICLASNADMASTSGRRHLTLAVQPFSPAQWVEKIAECMNITGKND